MPPRRKHSLGPTFNASFRRARVPSGRGIPNWADGFAGETFIWGFAAGTAAFAITLNTIWLWGLVALGFAIYFLQYTLRKRGQK